jgi:hypothetical protein
MTKLSRWYASMAFWTKIKYTVGLVGGGGTVTLVLTNTPEWMSWVVGGATFIGGAISVWMEDKNNDGIVDAFEKNYRKRNPN